MMYRKITSTVFAISAACLMLAQGGVLPLTGKAARLYQDKSYDEAKMLIEESLAGEGTQDTYTWQVRGHIYKEIYKQVEKFDRDSEARETAVESFIKCMELDSENKYLEWNRTSLRFLASTYWNDAVGLMESRKRDELPVAEGLFSNYLRLMQLADSNEDLSTPTLDFYRAYATATRKNIEEMRANDMDPKEYSEDLKRVENSYIKALETDPNDYGSNYNYAINLYNEAAYRIEKIDPETELTQLIFEQAGCVEIFERALPVALKAQDLRPGRIEILKALRAIYLSLSNYDEFDRYNGLVREKQGELLLPEKTKRELSREFFREQKLDDR